jgi:starvation-inducible DNA-binding protein
MKTGLTMETEAKINIGLANPDREGVVNILTTVLSDEYVLYTKTRNYHWNVVGPQFNDLHKFFQSQYEELDEVIDDVAERIRSVGGWSVATLTEFMKHARLKEHPGEYYDAHKMISNLVADHEAIIRNLRVDLETVADKYHDIGTNDFLTGLMEKHEKMAWMLRSFSNK